MESGQLPTQVVSCNNGYVVESMSDHKAGMKKHGCWPIILLNIDVFRCDHNLFLLSS